MVLESGCKLTPMMAQYFSIKKNYPEDILLFRMGDFYEAFFEDAQEISKLLNIVLSHRGRLGPWSVPMAGIPHHAAASYIDKLTSAGKKVAVAEQVEDPKDSAGLVKRAVTQVVSPGIPYDLDKAPAQGRHFIACAGVEGGIFFIVTIDMTTGDFLGFVSLDREGFLEKLRLSSPREIVVHREQFRECPELERLVEENDILPTYLGEDCFDPKLSQIPLERLIPGYSQDKTLEKYPGLLPPLCALAYYICSTQEEGHFYHIRPFRIVNPKDYMGVTLPTLTGLEILPAHGGNNGDSLLGFLDQTVTPLGSRKMRDILTNPLGKKEDILLRQKLVTFFVENPRCTANLRQRLSSVGDVERLLAKVSRGSITSTGVLSLSLSLKVYFQILKDFPGLPCEILFPFSPEETDNLREVYREISRTINDEVGASLAKGSLIKRGRNKERDRLADLLTNVTHRLEELEKKYTKETGMAKVKVSFNNVAGYYIEVRKAHSSKVPTYFQRRQTLVAAERYTTEELSRIEKEMMLARDNLGPIERAIFNEVVAHIIKEAPLLLRLASNVATLDAFSCLGHLALQEKFTRPILTDKKEIDIAGAWHPLIKSSLQDAFVPHDLTLGPMPFFALITGPNMAGKTTLMREVALIQVLAQIGSFVPAKRATIGLCDHLFSRLGAGDNIIRGQSTFMVEMSEAAEILRHATQDSLILLDEIGRGTSTYDGLGLAWSLVEYLLTHTRARALFATHYHELTNLIDSREEGVNLSVETQSKEGQVKFLYRLIPGSCGQSFGIHVARMAGLPSEVLTRAQSILKELEGNRGVSPQATAFPKEREGLTTIERKLEEIDPMNLTPLEALQKIHDLKSHMDAESLE